MNTQTVYLLAAAAAIAAYFYTRSRDENALRPITVPDRRMFDGRIFVPMDQKLGLQS